MQPVRMAIVVTILDRVAATVTSLQATPESTPDAGGDGLAFNGWDIPVAAVGVAVLGFVGLLIVTLVAEKYFDKLLSRLLAAIEFWIGETIPSHAVVVGSLLAAAAVAWKSPLAVVALVVVAVIVVVRSVVSRLNARNAPSLPSADGATLVALTEMQGERDRLAKEAEERAAERDEAQKLVVFDRVLTKVLMDRVTKHAAYVKDRTVVKKKDVRRQTRELVKAMLTEATETWPNLATMRWNLLEPNDARETLTSLYRSSGVQDRRFFVGETVPMEPTAAWSKQYGNDKGNHGLAALAWRGYRNLYVPFEEVDGRWIPLEHADHYVPCQRANNRHHGAMALVLLTGAGVERIGVLAVDSPDTSAFEEPRVRAVIEMLARHIGLALVIHEKLLQRDVTPERIPAS